MHAFRRSLALALFVLAGVALLAGCVTPYTEEDLGFGSPPTLRGFPLGGKLKLDSFKHTSQGSPPAYLTRADHRSVTYLETESSYRIPVVTEGWSLHFVFAEIPLCPVDLL